MSAKTVEQIITDALRDISVAAAGEPVDPEDLSLGQTRLNDVIDEFKADRGLIYQVIRETYAVSANVASYSIGPGAAWQTATRPTAIVAAGFINTAVTKPFEIPVRVYTDNEWVNVRVKSATSTVVKGVWLETSFKQTAPIGSATIYVSPVCTIAAQLALYLPTAFDEIAEDENGLATVLYVPPAYRKAFRTSLSVDLCDAFEVDLKQSLVSKWNRSMKKIRRANSKPMILSLPGALTRRGKKYNIMSNE